MGSQRVLGFVQQVALQESSTWEKDHEAGFKEMSQDLHVNGGSSVLE